MPSFVTLSDVSYAAPGGRIVFEHLNLALGGERTGLVGRNGVGKTTLLRLICGEAAPAAGEVRVEVRIAVLRQQLRPPPGATITDLLGIAEPLARLARIERGEATPGDLEAADWGLPQRAGEALAGMRLDGFALNAPAETLSGGEATRAALAALIIAEPDLMLMDEPTNNLDADGRAAVAELIEGWRKGALVVSHDRTLLSRMDRILELTTLGLASYGGGWELYRARKAEAEAAAENALERAEASLDRTRRAVQGIKERKARHDAQGRRGRASRDMPKMWFDAQAERAEGTMGRQSRLAERLEAEAKAALEAAEARVERVRTLQVALPPSGLPAAKTVLAFEHVSFAWPGSAPMMSDVSFRIVGPARLALVGANGTGKTTLLRLATGELAPAEGRIRRPVRAALLDQRAAQLDNALTLIQNFRRLNPAATDGAAHAALASFLFRNADALKSAGSLSGGERLRAALACALISDPPPQLVILDEPTNHLDLDSIAAVEAALAAYDGALLIASHDATFLEAVGACETLRLGENAA